MRDSAGNFYGTTTLGGQYSHGTVFKLTPDGTESVLYSFSSADNHDGQTPYGALILDDVGNLYGTTAGGGELGQSGFGTVFKIAPDGTETILHSFSAVGTDGALPLAALTLDGAGNLYGTTAYGGSGHPPPYPGGTVFRLATDGSNFTTLYSFFTPRCNFGNYPDSPVVFDDAGNLYSTTAQGGLALDEPGGGIVFKLTADGTCVVLHDFAGYTLTQDDGQNPEGGLILDGAGNLYGVTEGGGNGHCSPGCGTVFRIGTDGTGFTLLHDFQDGASDGRWPRGGLVLDGNGTLYGTTIYQGDGGGGIVFSIGTDGANFQLLHSFPSSGVDGLSPEGALILDDAGTLYGTTASGGPGGLQGRGVVFSVP